MSNRGKADRELDDELRAYVELLTAEKIKAGLPADVARRQALIETGGLDQVKERVRDVRRSAMFEIIAQDIRYAARSLARSPVFTLVAVLTLALGIGASAAIFTVVNGVLLRQLNIADASGVVMISESNGDRGLRRASATAGSFAEWRLEAKSFGSMAAYYPHNVDVTGRGEPQEVVTSDVSHEFFQLTGAEPIAGRVFRRDEFLGNTPDVVVIDEGYWRLSLGGDPGVLGMTLSVDARPRTVIGIVPAGWPRGTSIYAPLRDTGGQLANPNARVLVIGRLAAGLESGAARDELTAIARGAHANDPTPTENWTVEVASLLDTVVGNVRRALYLLLGAVGFVLLIVCANVSSLLFARAGARVQEIALRHALGASRTRIMRHLLAEGVLLTAMGALAGTAIAVWGVALLRGAGPESIPRLAEITIDSRMMLFTAGLTVLTGLLVAIAPAFSASGWGVHRLLLAGSRTIPHGRKSRSVLVVLEIAFATILVVGAGLMTRSMVNQVNIPLGFDASRVLALDIDIPAGRYGREGIVQFVRQVEERLRALPGVEAVGTSRAIPFESFGPVRRFQIDGRPPLDSREEGPSAFYTPVSSGYLATMRVPLLRGRTFGAMDDRPEAPGVVVINETMARRFWAEDNPLGARLRLPDGVFVEVIGVAGDVRQNQLIADITPAMWVLWPHAPDPSMLIVIRTAAEDPTTITQAAQRTVWSVDPLLPIEPSTLDFLRDRALSTARFNASLLAGFAVVALVLAALGVYALVSYSVSVRTREIGLRIALGAQRGQVERMILGQGAGLALLGLAIGTAASLAMSRFMGAVLYQVPARDPASLMAAIVVLGLLAALASWVPARRAAHVTPTDALKWTG